MSVWQEIMQEKETIAELVASGYTIERIIEELDGDIVRFSRDVGEEESIQEVRLSTADARKYLGVVLIEQIRK
ncbi:hypothetical protein D3C81_1755150 [compost metagenome]